MSRKQKVGKPACSERVGAAVRLRSDGKQRVSEAGPLSAADSLLAASDGSRQQPQAVSGNISRMKPQAKQ